MFSSNQQQRKAPLLENPISLPLFSKINNTIEQLSGTNLPLQMVIIKRVKRNSIKSIRKLLSLRKNSLIIKNGLVITQILNILKPICYDFTVNKEFKKYKIKHTK